MKATSDGFELSFLEPVDERLASDPATWQFESYSYIYQSNYGSPEVDAGTPKVTKASVLDGGKKVRMTLDGMKIGSVHELRAEKLTNKAGQKLLHPVAYYTLWAIPKGEQAAR